MHWPIRRLDFLHDLRVSLQSDAMHGFSFVAGGSSILRLTHLLCKPIFPEAIGLWGALSRLKQEELWAGVRN